MESTAPPRREVATRTMTFPTEAPQREPPPRRASGPRTGADRHRASRSRFGRRRSPPGAGARWRLPTLCTAALLATLPALSGCGVFEALGVDPLGPQPLAGAAQSAVRGRGNVRVTLEPDGTAIVAGWVDHAISEQAVLREVANYPGVTGVVDLLKVEDWYR